MDEETSDREVSGNEETPQGGASEEKTQNEETSEEKTQNEEISEEKTQNEETSEGKTQNEETPEEKTQNVETSESAPEETPGEETSLEDSDATGGRKPQGKSVAAEVASELESKASEPASGATGKTKPSGEDSHKIIIPGQTGSDIDFSKSLHVDKGEIKEAESKGSADDATDKDHGEKSRSDSAKKGDKKDGKTYPTSLEVSSSDTEEEEEEEEEEDIFPREEYIEVYRLLSREKYSLMRKNLLLQKKLYDYCKKRKLEVYFQELGTTDPKLEAKYAKQLNAFEEFIKLDVERRKAISEELQKLEKNKVEAEKLFHRNLEELIQKEREMGTGLISGTTGKTLQDKTLEKLLNRQRKAIIQLCTIRLTYIKFRDAVAAKEVALKKLETFGEGLHLVDYEQLRMENQSYSDKIEERDEELTRLRTKATSSIQILAHIREKANATATNIEDFYENLEAIEMETNLAREYIGSLKKKREDLRIEHHKLKNSAGLLVHQRLIKDFERSIEESHALAAEIENLKNSYHVQNRRLTQIKKSMKAVGRRSSDMLDKESQSESENYEPSERISEMTKASFAVSDKLSIYSKKHQTSGSIENIKKSRLPFFPPERISKLLKY